MATPEISHRCALCGAAIRPGAQSCPNCGEAKTQPATPLAQVEIVPPEPSVSSSWLMQPDLELDGADPLPATTHDTDEPEIVEPEILLTPPVYTPAPQTTEAPALELPALLPETEAEPEPEPVLLLEEAPPVLPETDTDTLTAEEKLALIKKAEPQVKVLDKPYQKRKRRRSHKLTLKERLAGRIAQLREFSFGASRRVAPAVDQLRHTSNAVLDRASDDPSARFLLIGALLVGVAAFVFFVSFFMG